MHDDSPTSGETPPVGPRDGADPAAGDDGAWSDLSPAAPIETVAVTVPPGLSPEHIETSLRALMVWLGILLVFGMGGVLFGQQELALLVAVSGVVMAAHAADFHPRFVTLYRIVSVSLIGLCGATLVVLAAVLWRSAPNQPTTVIVTAISLLSGLIMFATGVPSFAMAMARALFGVHGDSHGYRLATRLTLFGFLIAAPGWFAAQIMFNQPGELDAMFSRLTLSTAVFGYVILALASVGFLVRRDLRSTLERLGLTQPEPRHLYFVAIGVPLMFGLNWCGESIQQQWFHSLWVADHRVNDLIAGALSRSGMVALALSAGIGEEITMRGALQPKLGLVLTSLFFAALHVQYSWFGMAMIFGLGLLLGVIRQRTNTVVVMIVHAIYDMLALIWT